MPEGPKTLYLTRCFEYFTKKPKNRGPNKTQKMNPKNLNKSLLDPPKPQFYRGKTIGCEKSLFWAKKQKLIFWGKKGLEGPPHWTCFLQRFLKI